MNVGLFLEKHEYQALINPLSRLPRIAWNDRLATVFVGWSCPPNLYFETLGNKRFPASNSCSLHTLCALDFERQSAKWLSSSINFCWWSHWSRLHCIQFDYMISSVLFPDLHYQWHNANKTPVSRMVIKRYSTRSWYHVSCRNGHSARLQNLCVSSTRLWIINTVMQIRLPYLQWLSMVKVQVNCITSTIKWQQSKTGFSTVLAMEIIQGYGISSPLALYRN